MRFKKFDKIINLHLKLKNPSITEITHLKNLIKNVNTEWISFDYLIKETNLNFKTKEIRLTLDDKNEIIQKLDNLDNLDNKLN